MVGFICILKCACAFSSKGVLGQFQDFGWERGGSIKTRVNANFDILPDSFAQPKISKNRCGAEPAKKIKEEGAGLDLNNVRAHFNLRL